MLPQHVLTPVALQNPSGYEESLLCCSLSNRLLQMTFFGEKIEQKARFVNVDQNVCTEVNLINVK
jgi:hypothetical protein